MTIRVIQWATGAVGIEQLREIIDDPELELVGLFVFNAGKVGVDAGDIAGRPKTGILATNDKQAILSLDADLVLHAASKGFAENTNLEDIVSLLESGKSVISTTTYNHLPTYGRGADELIPAACEKAGVRFHAAGEHPGFMLERLGTMATGLVKRVDKITVQEFVDCSQVKAPEMMIGLMSMGKDPSEVSENSTMFQAVSIQYEQAINAAAELMGLEIDEIRKAIRLGTVDHEVKTPHFTFAPGTVVGQIMSWSGCRGGKPVLVCEEYWTVTDDIPGWNLDLNGEFLVKVIIEGQPSVTIDLRIDNGTLDGMAGSSGGHLAVAMTAVRAIPYVLAERPGVVLPKMFGTYRWRD